MSYKLAGITWNDDGTMAFERIKKELARHYININDIYEWTAIEDDLDIIETKLKALKIIKEKVMPLVSLDDGEFVKGCYRVYDAELYMHTELTKEEYELLKEVLK